MFRFYVAPMMALMILSATPCVGSDSDVSAIEPFNTTIENNPFDISRLKCRDFVRLVKARSHQLGPLVIWVHGVVSGLEKRTVPFTEKHGDIAMLGIAVDFCANKDDQLLFDVIRNVKR